ncbi:unnamed protein product, partial [Durusdinium trenchii]
HRAVRAGRSARSVARYASASLPELQPSPGGAVAPALGDPGLVEVLGRCERRDPQRVQGDA